MRRRPLLAAVLGLAAAAAGLAAAPARAAGPTVPPLKHVWVVVLENKSYDESFSANSPATYLYSALPAQGALLRQYYGTGHLSLDNYLSLLSGQGTNLVTRSDCMPYRDVVPGTVVPTTAGDPASGQALGEGCVYPAAVPTLVDQLEAKGLSWKGYLEDMGKDPARETVPCGQPKSGGTALDPTTNVATTDDTQSAEATDQYAARHNPFVYFHSILDVPGRCAAHVVPLEPTPGGPADGLQQDLANEATTPAFSFITPNLCDDAHDATCAGTNLAGDHQGGLYAADQWLKRYVPMITGSPAFHDGGMLVVTFDESDVSDTSNALTAGSCCGELPAQDGLNGLYGPGGGQIGAVVLSPYVTPGTVSDVGYNHYALLRTLEDGFGITTGGSDGQGHLGYAGLPTGARQATTTATAATAPFVPFGPDVFTAVGGPGQPLPESPLAIGLPFAAVAAGGVVVGVRRRRARR